MHGLTRLVRKWKPAFVDGVQALGELGLALVITSVWLGVAVVTHMLNTPDVEFFGATRAILVDHFEPADALRYVTGVLASSIAYIWFRRHGLKNYTSRLLFLLCASGFLWFLAALLYMVPDPVNVQFAERLAFFLFVGTAIVWWFALYTQRRILERSPDSRFDSGGQELTEELERGR